MTGSFFKPNLGLALALEPPYSNEGEIVEISRAATAIDDRDRTLQWKDIGPPKLHFHDFESSVPGAKFIYLYEKDKSAKLLKRLEGELLVTPGRVLVASFDGPEFNGRKTQRVGKETFTLESVKQSNEGIQISVSCPQTKAKAGAVTPEERFQALLSGRGAHAAEIEDNTGEVHRPRGSGSVGGSVSGSSVSGGQNGSVQFGFGGGKGSRGGVRNGQQASSNPSQSFEFPSLPEGRTIKTIRVRMVERTGPAKSVAFTLENIPIR